MSKIQLIEREGLLLVELIDSNLSLEGIWARARQVFRAASQVVN